MSIHFMADQLYRNKKTGERKHLPPMVYKEVSKQWEPIQEEQPQPLAPEPPIEKVKNPEVKANLEILNTLVEKDEEKEPEQSEPTQSKEELQAEYKKLSGEKPDGRWSAKKLHQLIQEQKENNK